MSEIIMRKTRLPDGRLALVPVDDQGREVLGKIKDNRDIGCDVIQRRNPRHHRLFFKILEFVREHSPVMEGVPTEKLIVAIKLATGLVDTFVDVASGRTVAVPRSMSFAAMDQTQFAAWFFDCCTVIASRWLPEGTTPEAVRDELIALVDGPYAIGERRA